MEGRPDPARGGVLAQATDVLASQAVAGYPHPMPWSGRSMRTRTLAVLLVVVAYGPTLLDLLTTNGLNTPGRRVW